MPNLPSRAEMSAWGTSQANNIRDTMRPAAEITGTELNNAHKGSLGSLFSRAINNSSEDTNKFAKLTSTNKTTAKNLTNLATQLGVHGTDGDKIELTFKQAQRTGDLTVDVGGNTDKTVEDAKIKLYDKYCENNSKEGITISIPNDFGPDNPTLNYEIKYKDKDEGEQTLTLPLPITNIDTPKTELAKNLDFVTDLQPTLETLSKKGLSFAMKDGKIEVSDVDKSFTLSTKEAELDNTLKSLSDLAEIANQKVGAPEKDLISNLSITDSNPKQIMAEVKLSQLGDVNIPIGEYEHTKAKSGMMGMMGSTPEKDTLNLDTSIMDIYQNMENKVNILTDGFIIEHKGDSLELASGIIGVNLKLSTNPENLDKTQKTLEGLAALKKEATNGLTFSTGTDGVTNVQTKLTNLGDITLATIKEGVLTKDDLAGKLKDLDTVAKDLTSKGFNTTYNDTTLTLTKDSSSDSIEFEVNNSTVDTILEGLTLLNEKIGDNGDKINKSKIAITADGNITEGVEVGGGTVTIPLFDHTKSESSMGGLISSAKDTLTPSSDYENQKNELGKIQTAMSSNTYKGCSVAIEDNQLKISYKNSSDQDLSTKSIPLSTLEGAKEATQYLETLKECIGFEDANGTLFAQVEVSVNGNTQERKIPLEDLNSPITFERAKAREETKIQLKTLLDSNKITIDPSVDLKDPNLKNLTVTVGTGEDQREFNINFNVDQSDYSNLGSTSHQQALKNINNQIKTNERAAQTTPTATSSSTTPNAKESIFTKVSSAPDGKQARNIEIGFQLDSGVTQPTTDDLETFLEVETTPGTADPDSIPADVKSLTDGLSNFDIFEKKGVSGITGADSLKTVYSTSSPKDKMLILLACVEAKQDNLSRADINALKALKVMVQCNTSSLEGGLTSAEGAKQGDVFNAFIDHALFFAKNKATQNFRNSEPNIECSIDGKTFKATYGDSFGTVAGTVSVLDSPVVGTDPKDELRQAMDDFQSTLGAPAAGSGSAEDVINQRLEELLSRIDTDGVDTIKPHFEALEIVNELKDVEFTVYEASGEVLKMTDFVEDLYIADGYTGLIKAMKTIKGSNPEATVQFTYYSVGDKWISTVGTEKHIFDDDSGTFKPE